MTTAALVSSFHPDFRELYKGLQSERMTSDIRHQMSLVLERQLSGQLQSYASSLLSSKAHPPLAPTASCTALRPPREHRKLDRSVSEPPRQIPPPPNSSRYKTELCRPYEENGACKYGDKCQFAHGMGELRSLTRHPKYKTELCRTFHSTGFCPYGPRCHFIHNSEDSKKCLLQTLKGSPPMSTRDYDFCSFSMGSAGELSPTGSTSSGSPASSPNSFFMDDSHIPVPHGVFFSEMIPSQGLDLSDEPPLPPKEGASAAIDIARNGIRLPIFSRLSLGSSP